jgi:hypothetical protein
MEAGEGELRLLEGESRLSAEPAMPAGRRHIEPPRLLVQGKEQERQRVRERHLRDLSSERPRDEQVAPIESASELTVRAPLRGHERMFAGAFD